MVDKTVKELRESIVNILCAGSVPTKRIDFEQTNKFKVVDSLIAAVRVDAEKKLMDRMWADQLLGYRVQLIQFPPDERRTCEVRTEVNGVEYVMVPASFVKKGA